MRLTLRSLLAYLDDVLGPNEAKEIGEKINASPEASALVARIREVIRRRRISAPELSGAGSGPDPNLVADYLENTLTPVEVVELERLYMESDVHLAEVAACHKILTMVMGHPLDVPDEVRERMYVLGATDSAKKVSSNELPLESQPVEQEVGEVSSLTDGLPDYLIKKSIWKRFSTIAIGLLVGLVWLALVFSDKGIWGVEDDSLVQTTSQQPSSPDEISNPVQPALTEEKPKTPTLANSTPTTSTPVRPAPVSVNPPAPGEEITATEITPAIPIPPQPGIEEEPTPPPKMTKPKIPTPPVVEVQPVKLPLSLEKADGLCIYMGKQLASWKVLTNEEIVGGDELAIPNPFRAQFSLGTAMQLSLEPGTRLKRLRDDEAGIPQIHFDRGRIVFSKPLSSEDESELNLQISGSNWIFKLAEPGTRLGVQVIPPTPSGPPGNAGPLLYEFKMGVFSGAAEIHLAGKPVQVLTPKDLWTKWETASKTFVNDRASLPNWVSPEGEVVTTSSRSLAKIYEKEFLIDAPVVQSIGPVIKDRVASNSHFAAQTLALIDHYIELVPALAAEHEETRIAAIQGLREWLVRSPDHGDLLIEEVARNFPDDEIETIVRLLWGYSADDLQDPAISREMLEYLKHDQIAIRELAFYYASRLGKTTKGYRPLLPPHERKAAIIRLESFLDQFGSFNPPSL